jgi:4-hydroxy-tetrahydrodipicolinate synthase
MHTICSHILKEDVEKAENINEKLRSLHKAMFIDSNPIPVKWLLNHLGLIKQGIRLPLVELDKKYHSVMIEAYEAIK